MKKYLTTLQVTVIDNYTEDIGTHIDDHHNVSDLISSNSEEDIE